MDRNTITPELRKKMNRAGIFFFLLALVLIWFLVQNFTKQYDPATRPDPKQKQRPAVTGPGPQ
ncbi:MAG: hypothetical protein HQM02_00535 [Magnetococcales bacterium]|nr:hypothetical protein [Magnetococcales bacterium]